MDGHFAVDITRDSRMNFHLGKPVLVLLIASLLSGVFIAVRPRPAPATLNMWICA